MSVPFVWTIFQRWFGCHVDICPYAKIVDMIY